MSDGMLITDHVRSKGNGLASIRLFLWEGWRGPPQN